MSRLFGTDGIRGRAGAHPLDDETVAGVGAALATRLGETGGSGAPPRILIGRDTRESGERIEQALARGAARSGAACDRAGVIPTPGVAYLTRAGGYAAGVMISASHNPYYDNGIKIFSSSGYKLSDLEEAAVEGIVAEGAAFAEAGASPAPAPFAVAAPIEKYVDHLRDSVSRGTSFSGLEVVLDCANGAGSRIAPQIFAELGAKVEAIFASPNGLNINSGCGSLYPERLAETVVRKRAHLGVAFDGDADRALLVAADGRIADGDILLYQAAAYLKSRGRLRGDRVVATVMSNLWLERDLNEIGVGLTRTNVGDRNVLEEMLRDGVVVGGEQSGHIIFTDRATTGDGILTALRMVEILTTRGETVADWLSRVQAFPQILLNVPVRSRPALETHPVIGAEAAKVREELGVTGRLVLRYSGTEELARVMIEAQDPAQVETLARRLAGVIREQIG